MEGGSVHRSICGHQRQDSLLGERERESVRGEKTEKLTFRRETGTVDISFGQTLSPAGVSHMSVFGPLCFAATTQEHLKGEAADESFRFFWVDDQTPAARVSAQSQL